MPQLTPWTHDCGHAEAVECPGGTFGRWYVLVGRPPPEISAPARTQKHRSPVVSLPNFPSECRRRPLFSDGAPTPSLEGVAVHRWCPRTRLAKAAGSVVGTARVGCPQDAPQLTTRRRRVAKAHRAGPVPTARGCRGSSAGWHRTRRVPRAAPSAARAPGAAGSSRCLAEFA